MQKAKAIGLILLGVLLAYAGSLFVQPIVNLDQEVVNVPLTDTINLKGYRNNIGNTTDYTYHYYILSNGDELPEPFLITDTTELEVIIKEDNAFFIHVIGEVYKFTNEIKVQAGETQTPIEVELLATPRPIQIGIPN